MAGRIDSPYTVKAVLAFEIELIKEDIQRFLAEEKDLPSTLRNSLQTPIVAETWVRVAADIALYYQERKEFEPYFKWLQAADTLGSETKTSDLEEIRLRLASCYTNGMGTSRDINKVIQIFDKMGSAHPSKLTFEKICYRLKHIISTETDPQIVSAAHQVWMSLSFSFLRNKNHLSLIPFFDSLNAFLDKPIEDKRYHAVLLDCLIKNIKNLPLLHNAEEYLEIIELLKKLDYTDGAAFTICQEAAIRSHRIANLELLGPRLEDLMMTRVQGILPQVAPLATLTAAMLPPTESKFDLTATSSPSTSITLLADSTGTHAEVKQAATPQSQEEADQIYEVNSFILRSLTMHFLLLMQQSYESDPTSKNVVVAYYKHLTYHRLYYQYAEQNHHTLTDLYTNLYNIQPRHWEKLTNQYLYYFASFASKNINFQIVYSNNLNAACHELAKYKKILERITDPIASILSQYYYNREALKNLMTEVGKHDLHCHYINVYSLHMDNHSREISKEVEKQKYLLFILDHFRQAALILQTIKVLEIQAAIASQDGMTISQLSFPDFNQFFARFLKKYEKEILADPIVCSEYHKTVAAIDTPREMQHLYHAYQTSLKIPMEGDKEQRKKAREIRSEHRTNYCNKLIGFNTQTSLIQAMEAGSVEAGIVLLENQELSIFDRRGYAQTILKVGCFNEALFEKFCLIAVPLYTGLTADNYSDPFFKDLNQLLMQSLYDFIPNHHIVNAMKILAKTQDLTISSMMAHVQIAHIHANFKDQNDPKCSEAKEKKAPKLSTKKRDKQLEKPLNILKTNLAAGDFYAVIALMTELPKNQKLQKTTLSVLLLCLINERKDLKPDFVKRLTTLPNDYLASIRSSWFTSADSKKIATLALLNKDTLKLSTLTAAKPSPVTTLFLNELKKLGWKLPPKPEVKSAPPAPPPKAIEIKKIEEKTISSLSSHSAGITPTFPKPLESDKTDKVTISDLSCETATVSPKSSSSIMLVTFPKEKKSDAQSITTDKVKTSGPVTSPRTSTLFTTAIGKKDGTLQTETLRQPPPRMRMNQDS